MIFRYGNALYIASSVPVVSVCRFVQIFPLSGIGPAEIQSFLYDKRGVVLLRQISLLKVRFCYIVGMIYSLLSVPSVVFRSDVFANWCRLVSVWCWWCRLVPVVPYGVGILTCFVNKSNCLLFCGQPQFVGFSLFELVLILSSVDCVGFDVVIRCVMWHNVIYALGMYSCFVPVQGGWEVGWNGNHWVMRSLWPIGLHVCSFQDGVSWVTDVIDCLLYRRWVGDKSV